jgi:sigma-B regulation protein RsbU (phosphoserine phosphatase)
VTYGSRGLYVASSFIDENLPWLGTLITVLAFGSYALGMVSLALNRWRAPSADVRRRTRVILWGLGFGPLPFLVLQLVALFKGIAYYEVPFWVWAPCVLAIFLMPLSVAYAVLKHQVLEVPVLLRRSARYLLVQRGFLALLVMAGVLVVVLATDLMMSVSGFSAESRQAGVGVALGAALAGVLTVWVLGRVHARVASRVDRAFFRSAYDARQILEDLIARSRSARSRDELLDLLQRRVGEALHATFLLVYLRDDARLALVGGTPAAALTGVPTAFATASEFVQALVARGRPLTVGEDELPPVPGVAPSSTEAVECLVPVLDREGAPLGLLVLGPRRSEEAYSGEDRRLLAGVAGQLGLSLESLALAEDIAHRIEDERRAAHEMEVARRVQANLLPQAAPELRSLELAAHCVQARAVGGDFYDYLELGPERLGLVLADISGKGMSAALLMSSLQAMVRSRIAEIPRDAVGVLQEINDRLLDTTTAGQFATLFLGDYDDVSRRFRYVNCGHNPPLLLRRDGNLEQLDATATVLGAFESWPCAGAEVELEAGDLLVIYSDGVTEVSDAQGEMFGEQRLADVVRAHRASPLTDLVDEILAAVATHGDGGPEDDLTLLTARVCPSPVWRDNADTHTDLATT